MLLRRYLLFVGLLLFAPLVGHAQSTGSVAGTVTDANDRPLPGVNVAIQAVQRGAATGPDGSYTISALEPGQYTIQASLVGYETQRATVTVEAGENVVQDFVMTAAS